MGHTLSLPDIILTASSISMWVLTTAHAFNTNTVIFYVSVYTRTISNARALRSTSCVVTVHASPHFRYGCFERIALCHVAGTALAHAPCVCAQRSLSIGAAAIWQAVTDLTVIVAVTITVQ